MGENRKMQEIELENAILDNPISDEIVDIDAAIPFDSTIMILKGTSDLFKWDTDKVSNTLDPLSKLKYAHMMSIIAYKVVNFRDSLTNKCKLNDAGCTVTYEEDEQLYTVCIARDLVKKVIRISNTSFNPKEVNEATKEDSVNTKSGKKRALKKNMRKMTTSSMDEVTRFAFNLMRNTVYNDIGSHTYRLMFDSCGDSNFVLRIRKNVFDMVYPTTVSEGVYGIGRITDQLAAVSYEMFLFYNMVVCNSYVMSKYGSFKITYDELKDLGIVAKDKPPYLITRTINRYTDYINNKTNFEITPNGGKLVATIIKEDNPHGGTAVAVAVQFSIEGEDDKMKFSEFAKKQGVDTPKEKEVAANSLQGLVRQYCNKYKEHYNKSLSQSQRANLEDKLSISLKLFGRSVEDTEDIKWFSEEIIPVLFERYESLGYANGKFPAFAVGHLGVDFIMFGISENKSSGGKKEEYNPMMPDFEYEDTSKEYLEELKRQAAAGEIEIV